MGKISIGIDLGTTNSCVAIFRYGAAETAFNEFGKPTTPSYVAFTKHERIVGQEAKNYRDDPMNVVYNVKRLIGRSFSDEHVQNDMKLFPFKIINENDKPQIEVLFHNEIKRYSAEQISAILLNKMKSIVCEFVDIDRKEIIDAVITIPAYFTDAQRQATKNAGTIAGLNVLRIINEPTAAAVAYGLNVQCLNEDEKMVLVFDLGGGTLDVTILRISNGVIEVKSTYGNTHLGGEDFDNRLVNHFVEEFERKFGKDAKTNMKAMSKLRINCEMLKINLSSNSESSIFIENFMDNIDATFSISRAKFENICSDLFQSTLDPVKKALEDAKIDKSQIDDILLVGGSSQIPKIRRLLRDYFNNKKLNCTLNPDETIAMGAAIQAAIINDDESKGIQGLVLLDVVSHSFGVETQGKVLAKLIPNSTTIPVKESKMFSTSVDNQSSVEIKVFEGENEDTTKNQLLGSFKLTGLPPAKAQTLKIEITFEVDANGILNVTAIEKTTGQQNKLTIVNNKQNCLTDESIKKMTRESVLYDQEEEERRKIETAKNRLLTYLKDVREDICDESSKDILSGDDITKFEQLYNETVDWANSATDISKDQFEEKLEYLKSICNPIIDELYGEVEEEDGECLVFYDENNENAPIQPSCLIEEVIDVLSDT